MQKYANGSQVLCKQLTDPLQVDLFASMDYVVLTKGFFCKLVLFKALQVTFFGELKLFRL